VCSDAVVWQAYFVDRKFIVPRSKPGPSPADAWMYQPWILDWARKRLGQVVIPPGAWNIEVHAENLLTMTKAH
jgi:hypothetical protein